MASTATSLLPYSLISQTLQSQAYPSIRTPPRSIPLISLFLRPSTAYLSANLLK
jgi:hypothetical protein